MSYSRNMPDWQQYSALQSGGSDAAKSGQNASAGHLYVPNISPPSMNGLNLSTDCHSKSQNDVINYSQRNYQPQNNTQSGATNLPENPLTSMVHMSSCAGQYGNSSTMNSMMDDGSNLDSLRNGSVVALNEEMAHRNQISLNGPVSRVMGPNMNVNNNMGTTGQRIPPVNSVPSNRQAPYMPACKGPCCVSDPNVNYQAWEKFTPYQATNPYRENVRASGYATADSRRYRNEAAVATATTTYRKESYPNKDLVPPNSYQVDQRRSYSDYKYCKDPPPVPRNYQTSTVLPSYPLPNYGVPGDYQKYAYTMKDYPRQGVMNSQNSPILKYPEHNVNMQEKYSPKQSQYQSGALLQKGLVVPSISTNISTVQNPYLNPQFSREYQWENPEKDPNKIQNPVPMHSTYPKYQLYQQKYAVQRFSMENHLRELSRIPGYQTHPKYQECIHRYRELLRLQQTVDYQSAIQNTLTTANSSVPPINLQFDQNGVLINPNYLPGSFPTHNPANPTNPVNIEKEPQQTAEKPHNLQRLQSLLRSHESSIPNNDRDVQYLGQKTIENPHCHLRREEERFEALNPREEDKEKSFAHKPTLDVRQFLANWDEAEEEEGANANLPDVVLSNSTPIVVVEYGNLGLDSHGPDNTTEQKENEPTMKAQEYYPKDHSNTLLQDCANDLNQGVVYANKLNIKCVGEGIDGVPTIHIVENPEGESCGSFAYNEKQEVEVIGGSSLPSLTETKECEVSESKEASSVNYKKLAQRNPDPKLQVNPRDMAVLPLAKSTSEAGSANLKKQNSYSEENHNQDDLSLPDLTTSECTPISTTLNTPTHSDSEECTEQGVDLTTSTNPIELIQNSPMISFTQSPVKMDPYEHLKGEHLSAKSSQDGLDFDFQNTSVIKSPISDSKKEEKPDLRSKPAENDIWPSCALEDKKKNPISDAQSSTKYSQVHPISRMIPENSANKDSNDFSSNMDVFSSEDQDKWCWNSIPLIPGEENEEPKIPAPPMEENYLTKIMKDSAPITSLNVLESDEEKTSKVDDMWMDVGCMDKGLDLSSDAKKTCSNEKFYNEIEQKMQKKKDFAEVSASVSKILKNIKERQDSIQNSMQDSQSLRRNSKGISIISEEIFNTTWQQNKQNKIYPPRKMSDSFEREELATFAENFKKSRSRSMNTLWKRSKSVENLKDESEEERLFKEFKNLKRKRSVDQFKEDNKLPKLSPEEEKKPTDMPAKHALPVLTPETLQNPPKISDVNQEKPATVEPAKPNSSDLEIKFRNCSDSNKPFEAIKIEINVSRSDGNSVAQSSTQKCGEADSKPNHDDPSTCGSLTCSGQNLKTETNIQSKKFEDSDKIVEMKGKKEDERKESVIEYFGKSQHSKVSQHSHAACDTCKSLNFHKIDQEYICTHLDNRITKPHENPESIENSSVAGSSTIDCLSNRLKSINKTKLVEDFSRKSKLQELKHFRKIKYKDKGCFSGFENKNVMPDKPEVKESSEIFPCTSEYSGSRLETKDLLKEDVTNTGDDTKHFVIKNSLNCDSSSFDEMPYKDPETNPLKSNLLEGEDSSSPKGFLNPIFSTLDESENLNTVPVYTTKDGKITYSPNPRFTLRTLLMEAQQKDGRSQYEKYTNYSSSTSYDKRPTKSGEKRPYSNKYHTDLKPPKKSLAKRFATQELEKSYQRYLSHKESRPAALSSEPMIIKTIKNYSAFSEGLSGNEAQDERQDSRSDFEDSRSQHENENEKSCFEDKIDETPDDLSEPAKIVETSTKNIERCEISESQIFTGIRSPSPGDAEDNQVVPVASGDKEPVIETRNFEKSDSTSPIVAEDATSRDAETLVMDVDKPQDTISQEADTLVMDIDNLQDTTSLEADPLGIDFDKPQVTTSPEADPLGMDVDKPADKSSREEENFVMDVDKKQDYDTDLNFPNLDSTSGTNLEMKDDIQDSNIDSANSKLEYLKDICNFKSDETPERRKSTSDVAVQSESHLLSERRKSESFVSSSTEINPVFSESLEVSKNREVLVSSQKESLEDEETAEINQHSDIGNSEVVFSFEREINSEVAVNSEAVVSSEVADNFEQAINSEIVENSEREINSEVAVNSDREINSEVAESLEREINSEIANIFEREINSEVVKNSEREINSEVAENAEGENNSVNFEREINSEVADNSEREIHSESEINSVNFEREINSEVVNNSEREIHSESEINSVNFELEINSEIAENSEREIHSESEINSVNFEREINSEIAENSEREINSEVPENFEKKINSEVSENSEHEINSEVPENSEHEINSEVALNVEHEINSEVAENSESAVGFEVAVSPVMELNPESIQNSEIAVNTEVLESVERIESERSEKVEPVSVDPEPQSCSESYFNESEKKREEEIIDVDVEDEVEIDLQLIEKDEVDTDLDKKISAELKEVLQDSEIDEKVDETESESVKEYSLEELKLANKQMEELIAAESLLELTSEITNLLARQENEISILNTEETSVEPINSVSENVEEDVLVATEEIQKEPEENTQVEPSVDEIQSSHYDVECEDEIILERIENVEDKSVEKETNHFEEHNQESNEESTLEQNSESQESELKNYEREYLETRGLCPSPSIETPKPPEDKTEEGTSEIIIQTSNCSTEINNEIDQSIQKETLPLIAVGDKDSELVYVDDESSCEVDPPTLELQKELSDSEMLNSPKSSDSNQFDQMPDMTLEENIRRESHLKSSTVDKTVPKLVIRKIESNRTSPTNSKSGSDVSEEPSFYRKVPKMIIRNAKSRPATPTIEEIPDELPESNEEANVIKVKIKLDDINKNEPFMFANEESRIPKMKIKLEDKLPKVVIENLDLRNVQDSQKPVPKVKKKKLKNSHSIDDDSKTSEQGTDSKRSCSKTDSDTSRSLSESDEANLNSELKEIVSDSSSLETEESRNKVPKLKIKKDLKIASSTTRKRHSSEIQQTENKKVKRSSKEEVKDRRVDPNMENSMSSSDGQSILEKVPKVIIKRTSPTAEFKCEVSKDKKNALLQDSSLQPQVVLQRSWILDCMAKELRHVNIALKLAIAKNGSKASVRGKSDSSKIQWEQFIRSLKKQKELAKAESGSEIFTNKIKQRRKSDCGTRYLETGSRFYKSKVCKSARESTNAEANYLENRSLYFKDMFSEKIQSNSDAFNSWKKFDENMNSESKDVFQDAEKLNFPNNFSDQGEESEVKLSEEVETKCTLLGEEVVDSKETLAPDISSFESFDENEANVIKMEEETQVEEVRPEFSTSLIANGEHEYLYSEDAIPTQFEFELEIVESSVDTYDVPMADIKEPPESNDAVEFKISEVPDDRIEESRIEESNDSDRLPRLLLPDEDSSLLNAVQDSSCDIKDEIPVLNNLLDPTETDQTSDQLASSPDKFSDSISLVQEVMAAKETLRKYLPKYEKDSSSKSKSRTLGEKREGERKEGDSDRSSSTKESSECSSSRSHTRYEKKRPKESSRSREKHKSRKAPRIDEESCKYDEKTISLRDQKRSSLHSTQSEESNKSKDSGSSRSKTESSSKRSGGKSESRSGKSRESSKDGDRSKTKSQKVPKISKSKEPNGESATEPKAKEDMPILEPEDGVRLDPSSDRDATLSPPLITNQEDVTTFEQVPKIVDGTVAKEAERVPSKMVKTVQVDPGVTLADAVQKWVFHEKATIKHRRYCVLCERWFPSVIRHRRHLSGYQHRHTELTQRRSIHTLFMLFTGKPCPRLLPADILRSDCSLGEATPLQVAVQNVALGYEKAHEMSKTKTEENKP
ncbi:uncharacterized protein LOC117167034 [Belonocnema kinseyi]|uniref:uncharacterized protein LOC117167034 n=1 Tax=Belonocnema kinseyi TaxID=2817044 RepID=UPI00143DF79E|nr:uncharacterized protein LOC117167034 [Belonocnema kinseyi]